jgi:hypothetical protein
MNRVGTRAFRLRTSDNAKSLLESGFVREVGQYSAIQPIRLSTVEFRPMHSLSLAVPNLRITRHKRQVPIGTAPARHWWSAPRLLAGDVTLGLDSLPCSSCRCHSYKLLRSMPSSFAKADTLGQFFIRPTAIRRNEKGYLPTRLFVGRSSSLQRVANSSVSL